MRIGFHFNTGGVLTNASAAARSLGANTMQIFSASPRMWRAKQPDAAQVRQLNEEREKYDIHPLAIHASYLINLAAPASDVRKNSINGFRGELERALTIHADYLIVHPGNCRNVSVEQGMLNVAEALVLAWREVPPALAQRAKLTVLLENTSGSGAHLGGQFAELATIRRLAAPYLDVPLGFCLDTCHCHVCGFDLSSAAGFQLLIDTATTHLGLENIPVIHTNDAKAPFNSHLDRHANIGAGYIGLEGFRRILNHPALRDKAFIMETPEDDTGAHQRDMAAVKELISPKRFSIPKNSSQSGRRAGRKTAPSMRPMRP